MSDTQPTPAAMEAANKIITDIESAGRPIADRIARALDAFKRDAVIAEREACARAMCCFCRDPDLYPNVGPPEQCESGMWIHRGKSGEMDCDADDIRQRNELEESNGE